MPMPVGLLPNPVICCTVAADAAPAHSHRAAAESTAALIGWAAVGLPVRISACIGKISRGARPFDLHEFLPVLPALSGSAGLRVEVAEHVLRIGHCLGAVVVRLVPDLPE